MTIVLFALLFLLLLVKVVTFIIFPSVHASLIYIRYHHHGKPRYNHAIVQKQALQARVRRIQPSYTLKMSNSILFRGDASSQCVINLPPNSSRSLPQWLRHTDSTYALLGSNGQEQVLRFQHNGEDGPLLWECPQPPLHWFGNEISFTVVNSIDRHEGILDKVSVSIMDTRMVYTGSRRQTSISSILSTENLLGTLMNQSKLYGGTELSWRSIGDNSWMLSAKLDLALHVPLPSLLPLPPGFNKLGSSIVKRTCKSRLVSNLQELKEQYALWAIQ